MDEDATLGFDPCFEEEGGTDRDFIEIAVPYRWPMEEAINTKL